MSSQTPDDSTRTLRAELLRMDSLRNLLREGSDAISEFERLVIKMQEEVESAKKSLATATERIDAVEKEREELQTKYLTAASECEQLKLREEHARRALTSAQQEIAEKSASLESEKVRASGEVESALARVTAERNSMQSELENLKSVQAENQELREKIGVLQTRLEGELSRRERLLNIVGTSSVKVRQSTPQEENAQ